MVPTFQTLWPCCGPHHASRSLSPRSRPLGDLRPPLRPRPRPSRRRRRYVAAASHHGVGHARALPPLAFEPPLPPPPLPPSCLVVLVVHVNTSWPLPGSRPTKTIVVFASPLLLSLLFLPHRETPQISPRISIPIFKSIHSILAPSLTLPPFARNVPVRLRLPTDGDK